MTEKELKQLYYLNKEVERLQKELKNKEQFDCYHSPILTGMPSGAKAKDLSDYAIERADLLSLIDLNLKKIQIEKSRLERYISSIEDSETRLIFRLRHINGMKWEDIGDEMKMDRRTVSRKHFAYLKKCPQCPRHL